MARESTEESQRIFWENFYESVTDYKQMVFLDESWRNDKTVNKKRGRSRRGTRCKATINMSRGPYKLNLSLAVNWNVPLAYEISGQKIDAEDFLEFLVNDLGPFMNAYPGSNSVLVMDNWYTHDTVEVLQWCAMMEVIPLFEPAHDPPKNLTEWVFNAIKMKEKAKGIWGSEPAAARSLIDSIDECVGCNWKSVMDKIGYIDGMTDSDRS